MSLSQITCAICAGTGKMLDSSEDLVLQKTCNICFGSGYVCEIEFPCAKRKHKRFCLTVYDFDNLVRECEGYETRKGVNDE